LYATDVFDVAAVKFGSLIQTTAELGVIIISSTGLPFIQSRAIGLEVPTLDSVTLIALANPITRSVVRGPGAGGACGLATSIGASW
jgi:hypothetical protein